MLIVVAVPGSSQSQYLQNVPSEQDPVQSRAVEAVSNWVSKTAIKLRGAEPGQPRNDMQPLKSTVANARVVALGEATHGTREFSQIKHRFLEFLVQDMGFTIFAIEAPMAEAFDLNEYVLQGKGDPAQLLSGLEFWTVNTEEVLELVNWMRQYNENPRNKRKLKFYGLDMQAGTRAAKNALAYLKRIDPSIETDARLRWLTDALSRAIF